MRALICMLLFVLLVWMFTFFNKTEVVQAIESATLTPTIVNPVFGFSIGYASSSGAVYAPKNGEICKVWDDISNGYLSAFRPQTYNKKYLFIKFTSNAVVALGSNNVECEGPSNYSSEDRMNWYTSHQTYKATYTTNNSKAIYVDGNNLAVVTLTPTPTTTSTPSSTNTVEIVSPKTPTPKPAPPPTLVFYTGDSIDTTQNYAPRKNDICWTWNQYIGRIGDYRIPSGKQALVIKFLTDQTVLLVNNVICENSDTRTPEERASWLNYREPWYYPWNKIVTYYVSDSMEIVTLTATPTVTNTGTATGTATQTQTSTVTETETRTETITPTATVTSTQTRTKTPTPTVTITSTPTITPALMPDKLVPVNVSTLHIPKSGHICYGHVIGELRNRIVEFVSDYQYGIEISGGGCFTSKYYTLSQVMRYLESRGIRLSYESLPRPTLTPSRTLPPTATIIKQLLIGLSTDRVKSILVQAGTVCWGERIGNMELKVVRFQKNLTSPIFIYRGGCSFGQNLSAEDVFNYLKRNGNSPLNGFVELK